ncbi:MAG: caspase family protein [Candidatus Melainabacteria bacterium]|nr:caspase family protein [Candidatus Melainabacteria bacterium]
MTATGGTAAGATAADGTAAGGTAAGREQAAGAGEQSSDPNRPIRDKWAVIIGIDKFQDSRIPALHYSTKDARDFANFLVEKGNFAKDHVLLLLDEDATQRNIEMVLGDDWLPRRVLADDIVLIFASTHGSPKELDVAGENFLIAYDTDPDNLFSSGIELETLAQTIKRRTNCDRVVLFLDACNSGAAAGGKGLLRTHNFDLSSVAGQGMIIISSSSADQRSWESKRYENGVFTRKLIDSLQVKGVATNLSTAFNNLKDQVEQEVKFDRRVDQVPMMLMNWKGEEVALLSRPTRPRQSQAYALPRQERNLATGSSAQQPGTNKTAPVDTQGVSSSTRPPQQLSDLVSQGRALLAQSRYSEAIAILRRAAEAGDTSAALLVGSLVVQRNIAVDSWLTAREASRELKTSEVNLQLLVNQQNEKFHRAKTSGQYSKNALNNLQKSMQAEIDQAAAVYRKEFTAREAKLEKQLKDAITRVATSLGYTYADVTEIKDGTPPVEGKGINITDEVIKELNK